MIGGNRRAGLSARGTGGLLKCIRHPAAPDALDKCNDSTPWVEKF